VAEEGLIRHGYAEGPTTYRRLSRSLSENQENPLELREALRFVHDTRRTDNIGNTGLISCGNGCSYTTLSMYIERAWNRDVKYPSHLALGVMSRLHALNQLLSYFTSYMTICQRLVRLDNAT